MNVSRVFTLPALLLLAGCASHEGGLSSAPIQGATSQSGLTAAKPQALSFRYAPDQPEYSYAVLTTAAAGGGGTRASELDFIVKVSRKGDQFTNISTIKSMQSDGKPAPGLTDKIKAFRVETVSDSHGKIGSSHITAGAGLLPPEAKDLGSAFELPPKPMLPGSKWTRHVRHGAQDYAVAYTLTGVETVGKQRIATFEEQGSDIKGAKTPSPTIIKIDADTGVMVDKLSEVVLTDPTQPGHDITMHFEIKLR